MAAAAAVFSLAGCGVNDESGHHFSNKLYINTSVSTEEILFKASTEEVTESRELAIATAIPVSNTVSGRFVYEPGLAEKYNMSYGKEALALPDGMVILDEPEATIVPGSVESAPVTIQFKGTEQLDRENIYVAPVHLVDIQGIDALGSKTVVYYVFRGASLINVVADIAENYFPVKWNSNVSGLKSVTVEALMRVRDFGTVGGKKGEAMSTLFGIEGTFLIRIGDAGFPQNQICHNPEKPGAGMILKDTEISPCALNSARESLNLPGLNLKISICHLLLAENVVSRYLIPRQYVRIAGRTLQKSSIARDAAPKFREM